MRRIAAIALVVGSCLATPAIAQQSSTALPSPEEAAKTFTVAGGAAYLPDYEGSNDYRIIPALAVRGEVGGVGIVSRGTYLYADFFPRRGEGIDLDLGPVAGVRINRRRHIDDPVVELLPKTKTAIEVGGFAGVSLHGLTNPYDTLGFRVDALHDIGNAHESTIISPNVEFSTPLSRFTYASASAGLEFVGNKYADYYYAITPADALATGLPVYDPDGGLKNWKLGLLLNQSVTGDLTGGLSVFGAVNYSRLMGDFKDAPIVRIRGSASQWLLAAGLAYTF
jgi:MipA family protein